ncbi:MAG TPA: DUF4252 domain-containing protein, partial [Bacteroidales bacterium]|nr:DUF4252 domain-containing protein [Bacteroidales bacterium]
DGFTTVYISGRMFSLIAGKTDQDKNNIMRRLRSIKILTVEDPSLNSTVNFYKEIEKKLDNKIYEELMIVKDSRETTKFLIRQKGDIITELIVISGGPGGNALISIEGDLDLKTISEISKSSGIEELKELDNIEKKIP